MKQIDEAPPIGLVPRSIWRTRRIGAIVQAVDRFVQVGEEIPKEWIEEYNELVRSERK